MTNISAKTTAMSKFAPEIQRIRDFGLGESALKTATYIRSPTSWEDVDKRDFERNAYVFNATKRTIDGFSGMITLKPATIDLPSSFDDLRQDIDGIGTPIDGYINKVADELCSVGNLGLLVDYPESGGVVTIAQAQANGLRPSLNMYAIESVLEVKHEKRGNKYILSRVRLLETYVVQGKDEFTETEKLQYRVLDLFEGNYRVRIFRENALYQEIFPRADGKALTEIPFRLITATGSVDQLCRPPLDDLAQVNIDHLNDSAWHQRAIRFCGSPFYMVAGMTEPEGGFRIGSSRVLFVQDASGKSQVVTAPAESVGAIFQAMENKRSDMAVIGARFLQADTSGNIAENTAVIHRSGDNATLSSISASIEQGMTELLKFCALFMGEDNADIGVKLSREYLPNKMTAQELTSLVSAWQQGGMTVYDLYDNLVAGEIIQPREGGADQFQQELAEEGFADQPINVNNNAPVQ